MTLNLVSREKKNGAFYFIIIARMHKPEKNKECERDVNY